MSRHVIPPAVKYAARRGYWWPGGYEMHTICSDGGCLCHQCTAAEWRQIAHDTVKGWASGWRAIDAGHQLGKFRAALRPLQPPDRASVWHCGGRRGLIARATAH
jgi:hypothetical protein